MRPIVVLATDATLDALEPAVTATTANVKRALVANPDLAAKAKANGWTPRPLAYGILLGTLGDLFATGAVELTT